MSMSTNPRSVARRERQVAEDAARQAHWDATPELHNVVDWESPLCKGGNHAACQRVLVEAPGYICNCDHHAA